MKRIIITFFVLSIFVLGGLIIAPSFVDWNKHKPRILEQLNAATGHKYTIDGPLELAILPYPHVAIDKLKVETPTSSGDYPIVELDEASVQLALMPLFSGEIVVSKVVLIKPVFQLAIGQNGAQSWMTPVLQKKMESRQDGSNLSKELADAVALNQISIKEGSFTFTDFRSGQKLVLTDMNMTLHGDSLYGPYSLEGELIYDGTKAKLKLNSGRVDKLAESISVQLGLDLPDLASKVSYSGIAAFKDKQLDLQGETSIDTPDLAALMSIVSKKPVSDYLKRPVMTRGILTLDKDQFAYRNMSLAFGGAQGNGYIVVQNFQKDAKGPLDVNFVIETTKPYKLENFLPPQQEGNRKPFLPETITVPRDITGAVNIKSAAVQYKGMTFQNVAFTFDKKEKGFGGQLNIKMAGNSTIDINSSLNFGSQSKSAQDGSVTFSDPVLNLETKLLTDEPLALLKVFGQAEQSPAMTNLLAHKLAFEAQLGVKPHMVDISDMSLRLSDTKIAGKGSYTSGAMGTRDVLKVTISSIGLDADQWIKRVMPAQNPAAVQTTQKPDILAITKTLDFPFDIDFSVYLQGLRFKGIDYTKLAAVGRLIQSQLILETLQLESKAGDSFLVAGGVNDINGLRGLDMSLQAKLPDPHQTLAAYGIDADRLPTSLGEAEILTNFKGHPEKLAFTVNLQAMRATMEASGEIADGLTQPKVSDLTLRLKHPNYVELARIYNPKFNSGVAIKKNLDVFASMSRKDNVYSFSQLQATIGPTLIKGDVIADVSGTKPNITAALEFTDMPIDDLLGIRTGKGGTVRSQPLNNQDVRWSRNAIDTAFLHKANITLKATANTISYGNWNFTNTGMNLDLKDGNLDIRQLDGGLYGGHVALTGKLKTSDKERQPLSFAGDVLAQDVDLEQFVSSFSGSQLVKARGKVSVQSNLQTSGLSPAALIFDLKGKGTANGSDIVFEGFDLARLSRALAEPSTSFTENFTRLLDASMKGGTTTFDTLDGVFTITEGVINFDKMDLDGPSATVATKGTVSLPLWAMDIESTVQLKEPEDAPPLKASFKGPIDKPSQTFGQNAMQQYFQKQIEGTVISPLLDEVDESGILKQIMGIGNGAKKQQQAPVPQEEPQQQVAPQQTPVEQQPQSQKKKEITPEEAIFGVIKGVLGD